MKEKIKIFWKKYEYKMILCIGLVLVSGLSFQMGLIKGKKISQNPLIIEKPIELNAENNLNSKENSKNEELEESEQKNQVDTENSKKDCAFVGSKNSNKYHTPASRCAKQIKPENLVCFTSTEAAIAKGYHTGCIE